MKLDYFVIKFLFFLISVKSIIGLKLEIKCFISFKLKSYFIRLNIRNFEDWLIYWHVYYKVTKFYFIKFHEILRLLFHILKYEEYNFKIIMKFSYIKISELLWIYNKRELKEKPKSKLIKKSMDKIKTIKETT